MKKNIYWKLKTISFPVVKLPAP